MTNLHKGFITALKILTDISIQPIDLYEKWWSGFPRSSNLNSNSKTTFHADVFSRRIRASSASGSEIHTLGHQAVSLNPGDFFYNTDKNAIIRRWATWSSSHWNWMQGIQIPVHPVDPWQIRIYIPSTDLPNELVADAIFEILNFERISFRMKYRRSLGKHSDSIVIWIEQKWFDRFFETMNELLQTYNYTSQPPPLTFQKNNVGVCDHPPDGQSVGWMYSELLWEIARTGSQDSLSLELERRKLNPEWPWCLNPASKAHWEGRLNG